MGTTLRRVLVVAAIAWSAVVWALPPLEPYRGQGLEFQVPRGWTVTIDEAAGTVLVSEDPNDPVAAAMLLLVVPHQPGLDAAYLTEAVLGQVAAARTELGREAGDGVVWTLQSFEVEGVSALLTSVAISRAEVEVASIALFSARAEAFEALGGAALLFVTFAGADPAWFEDPAATAAPSAGRFPPLEPIAELGGAYLKPAGWHYDSQSVPGQDLIYLLEDPADGHAGTILLLTQGFAGSPPAGIDVVAGAVDWLGEGFGMVDVAELRRSGDALTGARLLTGTRLGRPTKAFVAVFSDDDAGRAGHPYDVRVYGIVAPAERFDALGGHGLMWVTLGGMSVDAFERSDEMQAWYRPADRWGDGSGEGASAESLAAQQMMLDMQSEMFMNWINNMGGGFCWGDSYGCY